MARTNNKLEATKLEAPDNLGPIGQEAWRKAVEALGDTNPETMTEQIGRYARAADLAARLQDKWEKDGRPITVKGGATGKADVTNPIIKLISDAEKDAATFWHDLFPNAKRPVGRPRGSSIAPSPPKFSRQSKD
jgi:phage terminase small subunit